MGQALAINLTMMLVNPADAFWAVDNARKGLLRLSGIGTPSTWTITAVAGGTVSAGSLKILLRAPHHLSCQQLDIVVVIYRTATHR